MDIRITTNGQARRLLDWSELTHKERAEFDYIGQPENEECDGTFFRYRGEVYDLGEFMRTVAELKAAGWDGYAADSFFSGVVVKFHPEDTDYVIVGRYCC